MKFCPKRNHSRNFYFIIISSNILSTKYINKHSNISLIPKNTAKIYKNIFSSINHTFLIINRPKIRQNENAQATINFIFNAHLISSYLTINSMAYILLSSKSSTFELR